MKEQQERSLLEEVANAFGMKVPEKSRALTLGGEDRQIILIFGDNTISIWHHLGDRVGLQLSPVTFDMLTSWKIEESRVLFRRQIKGFDQTLEVFPNGKFIFKTTDPADWPEEEQRG